MCLFAGVLYSKWPRLIYRCAKKTWVVLFFVSHEPLSRHKKKQRFRDAHMHTHNAAANTHKKHTFSVFVCLFFVSCKKKICTVSITPQWNSSYIVITKWKKGIHISSECVACYLLVSIGKSFSGAIDATVCASLAIILLVSLLFRFVQFARLE